MLLRELRGADAAVCRIEGCQLLLQAQHVFRHGRILQYGDDVSRPHGIPVLVVHLLYFPASPCHHPYRRMLRSDGNGSTYHVGIFKETPAYEEECQHYEEHRDAPSYQCMRRTGQYLLHLLTPQFYVLPPVFHFQLSILKAPADSSPAYNTFLPSLSVPRASPFPLSVPALSPLSGLHSARYSAGGPPLPMSFLRRSAAGSP